MNPILIRLAVAGGAAAAAVFGNVGASGRTMGNNVAAGAQTAKSAIVQVTAATRSQADAMNKLMTEAARDANVAGRAYGDLSDKANRLSEAASRFGKNRRAMGLQAQANEARELADELLKTETNARKAARAMAQMKAPDSSRADKLQGLNTVLGQAGEERGKYENVNNALGGVRNVGMGMMGAAAVGTYALSKGIGLASTKEAQLKSIEALSGSREKADEIYRTTDEMSVKSVANLPELVGAAKTLTAARIFSSRNLTATDDLAAVKRDEGVTPQQVASMFARLKAGDFGEAFERARDFGIGRDDLKKQGLEFDGQGSFQGTVEQAVEGVVKVIEEKFGGLSEKLATETLDGAVSNLKDALGRVATSISAELIPAVTVVTRWLTRVAGFFTNLPSPIRKLIAWGAALAIGLYWLGGIFLTVIGVAGQVITGIQSLNGILAATSVQGAAAGGGLGIANLGLKGLMLGAMQFALVALAAVAVLVGAYLVWKKYADEIKNPTESVSDQRTGDQKSEDASNAKAVKTSVEQGEAGLSTKGKLQLYRAASQKLMDLGDSEGAQALINKSNALRDTAAGRKAVAEGALNKSSAVDAAAAKAISQFASLKDNQATRMTAVKRPKADDGSGALGDLKAQMATAMAEGTLPGAGAALPVATAAHPAAKMAAVGSPGAASNIEALEDQIAAAEDKDEKKALREQMRLARRAEKHGKASEREIKKQEREAAAARRIESQAAGQGIRADVAVRMASVKDARRDQKENEKDALDEQVEHIQDQVRAGAMDKDAARDRIDDLKDAFRRRNRALDAASRVQAMGVQAQAILAEAEAKAKGQTGAARAATLKVAQMRANSLAMQAQQLRDKSTAASAGASGIGNGDPANSGGVLDYLRGGGSLFDLVKGKRVATRSAAGDVESGAEIGGAAASNDRTFTVRPTRKYQDSGGNWIFKFEDIVVPVGGVDRAAGAF